MKKIAITIILVTSMLLTQVLIVTADENAIEQAENIQNQQIEDNHRPPHKPQDLEVEQQDDDADTDADVDTDTVVDVDVDNTTLYNIELFDDDDLDDDDLDDDDMSVDPNDDANTTPIVTITPDSSSDPTGKTTVTYGDYVSWSYKMEIEDFSDSFDSDMYSLSNDLGFTTSSAINKNSGDVSVDIEFYGEIKVAAKDGYKVSIKFDDGDGTTEELSFSVNVLKADISTEIDDMTYGEAEEVSFDLGTSSTTSVVCSYFSDADCTESVAINSQTDVGTYYANIYFAGDDYYNSVDTVTSFDILKADISTKITEQDETYFEADQTSVEKDLEVYLSDVVLGQDYTVTYEGTQDLFGEITMTIDGIGNYDGSYEYEFNTVVDENNQATFSLKEQIEYTLNSAEQGLIGWLINDDGLVYSNGITFYVDQAGEYTITAVYEEE